MAEWTRSCQGAFLTAWPKELIVYAFRLVTISVCHSDADNTGHIEHDSQEGEENFTPIVERGSAYVQAVQSIARNVMDECKENP